VIVLDTHAWLWWVSGSEALSAPAREAIERHVTQRTIHLSSISTWEVTLLVKRRRLELTMDVGDWIANSEPLPFLRFVPVTNQIAVRAVNLPNSLHSDPADRLIIATTRFLGAKLVTKDERNRNYPYVETIW
jgi:PIN domain nuclease of toxin-antitoxin system